MRQTTIFIATFFISVFACNALFAQVDTIAVSKIKAFTKYIDSLADSDEKQQFIIKSIAEGTIRTETVLTSKIGHHNNVDTIRKTKNGGFSKQTIGNIKGDMVYRIIYHDNIDRNFYECYYFKDNRLIYAKIDYQENGTGPTFYYREEFYDSENVLFVNELNKPIDATSRQRVTFDLRKKGNGYLKEFFADKK